MGAYTLAILTRVHYLIAGHPCRRAHHLQCHESATCCSVERTRANAGVYRWDICAKDSPLALVGVTRPREAPGPH